MSYRIRMPLWLAVAAALAVALSPPAVAQECASVEVAGGAAGAGMFTDGFETGDASRWGVAAVPTFSIAATVDLLARVALAPDLAGEHLLELRWYVPGGHLYQSLSVPFAVTRAPAGAAREVPGYPFPVALRSPGAGMRATESGSLVVEEPLPVAGTPIATSSLVGDWALEALLDGAESPCAPVAAFRLEL